jgi:hypothetical protein
MALMNYLLIVEPRGRALRFERGMTRFCVVDPGDFGRRHGADLNRQVSFGAVPPIRAGHECTGIMSPIADGVHIAEAATVSESHLVVSTSVRIQAAAA